MSWQKCPICNGTGKEYQFGGEYECSVCNGTKIISTISGKPPSSVSVKEPEMTLQQFEELKKQMGVSK